MHATAVGVGAVARGAGRGAGGKGGGGGLAGGVQGAVLDRPVCPRRAAGEILSAPAGGAAPRRAPPRDRADRAGTAPHPPGAAAPTQPPPAPPPGPKTHPPRGRTRLSGHSARDRSRHAARGACVWAPRCLQDPLRAGAAGKLRLRHPLCPLPRHSPRTRRAPHPTPSPHASARHARPGNPSAPCPCTCSMQRLLPGTTAACRSH
jgi:hypothetical protein